MSLRVMVMVLQTTAQRSQIELVLVSAAMKTHLYYDVFAKLMLIVL